MGARPRTAEDLLDKLPEPGPGVDRPCGTAEDLLHSRSKLSRRATDRQKNDPFKELEERSGLWAFASMGECPVTVLWVRRSETNRPSKCLEDTRGELARKGLTHRRMSNDSPKIKWSCQRVNEQVGVGIPRQFSSRDGLLDQV